MTQEKIKKAKQVQPVWVIYHWDFEGKKSSQKPKLERAAGFISVRRMSVKSVFQGRGN